VSAQQLIAFFSLEGEFPHERFQPRILTHQAGFFPVVLLDVKGPRRMREKLVAPLIVEGLANLILVTQFRDGSALKALDHDLGCGLGGPCPSMQG
jgi:hypothetical protein